MAACGIAIAGIADHDTLSGLRQLRAAQGAGSLPANGPHLIPSVEINSIADRALLDLGVELEEGELHILGYGFDADDPAFERVMNAQRDSRKIRLDMIVDRLRDLGVPIDEQIAPFVARGEALGRPHIARAMVEAGYVASVQEAFDRWIDRSGPAYVPRQGIKSRDAVDAILAAGGIPVLAHYPAAPEQPTLMRLIMDWGIQGLEVYYRRFTLETVAAMEALASELNLIATGGSDYHGDTGSYAEAMQTTYVPRRIGEALVEAIDRAGAQVG
jgi:predicted metal-dependent phosphoesterase TrpH